MDINVRNSKLHDNATDIFTFFQYYSCCFYLLQEDCGVYIVIKCMRGSREVKLLVLCVAH